MLGMTVGVFGKSMVRQLSACASSLEIWLGMMPEGCIFLKREVQLWSTALSLIMLRQMMVVLFAVFAGSDRSSHDTRLVEHLGRQHLCRDGDIWLVEIKFFADTPS